jgi:RimJ/RimL family protein N-acetyltransferase
MQFLVPERLETERLILRQFRNEDWRDLHLYYSDPEATKYTVGRAFTEGETWRAMCSMLGHWQIHGYGPYAVEERATGTVLGPVGFWYPNDWPSPEIKWALAASYWGRGFAAEAARAVQQAGRRHLPEIALISLILSANEPSKRLAVAVGARFESEIEFRGQRASIYRHPR